MKWFYLSLATILDVAGTTVFKTDRFGRPGALVLGAGLYAVSMVPFMIALRRMDMSTAYAAWSALATVGMAIVGILYFRESASLLKIFSFGLIIIGVALLNLER